MLCTVEPGGYLQWTDFDFTLQSFIYSSSAARPLQELSDLVLNFYKSQNWSLRPLLKKSKVHNVHVENHVSVRKEDPGLQRSVVEWQKQSIEGVIGRLWLRNGKTEEEVRKLVTEYNKMVDELIERGEVFSLMAATLTAQKVIWGVHLPIAIYLLPIIISACKILEISGKLLHRWQILIAIMTTWQVTVQKFGWSGSDGILRTTAAFRALRTSFRDSHLLIIPPLLRRYTPVLKLLFCFYPYRYLSPRLKSDTVPGGHATWKSSQMTPILRNYGGNCNWIIKHHAETRTSTMMCKIPRHEALAIP